MTLALPAQILQNFARIMYSHIMISDEQEIQVTSIEG